MQQDSVCGEGGIRTLDRLTPILVFETSAFNHSATSPDVSDDSLVFEPKVTVYGLEKPLSS